MEPLPPTIDSWEAWRRARYWAERCRRARSQEEKDRCYRKSMDALKEALTGKPAPPVPGQRSLFFEVPG